MACSPDTSPKIVGWKKGARTCLHVCPGRLTPIYTVLECHFNKTTHHHDHSRDSGQQTDRQTDRQTPGGKWKELLSASVLSPARHAARNTRSRSSSLSEFESPSFAPATANLRIDASTAPAPGSYTVLYICHHCSYTAYTVYMRLDASSNQSR
jgi:hypothetical protein